MVGVQDEDLVERVRQHRIDLVLLARHREAHIEKVLGEGERVLRIDEGLADGVFVGHRGQRRDFRDHPHRCDHALGRIVDVGGVVIERRQRADGCDHDRHRMGVAAETLEEPRHLLVDHGVMDHAAVEIFLLRLGRQFAVKQQVAGFQEVAVLGELLDRIAAVFEDAGVEYREIVGLVADRERCGFGVGCCVHREVPDDRCETRRLNVRPNNIGMA